MQRFIKMICTTALLAFAIQAKAEPSFTDLKKADKISNALTGSPMSDEQRNRFIAGTLTLEQLTEEASKSPAFIDYFAQHWAKLLGIQQGIDPWRMTSQVTNLQVIQTLGAHSGQDRIANEGDHWSSHVLDQLIKRRTDSDAAPSPFIYVQDCQVNGKRFALLYWYNVFTRLDNAKRAYEEGRLQADDGTFNNITHPDTRDEWKRMYEWLLTGWNDCNNPNLKVVHPWWDPSANIHSAYHDNDGYMVVPALYNICGGDTMKNCDMNALPQIDPFTNNVSTDIAMEPAYLIATTVAEDRSFKEVLTTTDTVVTGTYGAFMTRLGKSLWVNFPRGTIDDINHPIFKTPNVEDRKHYRIKRGAGHAGVLTTVGYQTVTNGRRAKANRAYETFLCNKFAVPDGVNPDPTDFNTDLTKRTYCNSCHKTLEPMAAFFNAWPETGNTQAHYNDKNVDDNGRFDGTSGKGAPGYGNALVNSSRFESCSVQRAFEFVNGRKMTIDENNNLTADYVKALSGSNDNLRSVIKAMVLSPDFLEPKGAGQ